MSSVPVESQPYVIAMAIMAALFVAALVRVWLLRREEEKLTKCKEALEKQVLTQQKDLMTVRQEANAWRTEMQRQFDAFRHMASDQLGVEERRFDELLKKSERRQYELQTALDLARQMCAELPAAKARVMLLESALGVDGAENPETERPGTSPAAFPVAPMPDVSGGTGAGTASPAAEVPAVAPVPPASASELEKRLAAAEQQNALLQQALTAARLRSRLRGRSAKSGGGSGKN